MEKIGRVMPGDLHPARKVQQMKQSRPQVIIPLCTVKINGAD